MAKNRPAGSRGKSGPTSAQQRLAAQRAAAARERIAVAQRRRRLFAVGGAVLAVVAIVAVFVIVKVVNGDSGRSGDKAKAASSPVLKAVQSVPVATLNAVGTGSTRTPPKALSGAPALTADGKPRVLYVGAEYCPYCAAERWAVAVALSRFGKLSNVGEVTSSPKDVYPSTSTLSFHGATYQSSVLSLTAKELQSNQFKNGEYTPLDKLNSTDTALVQKYNAPPYVAKDAAGAIPFVDIGGKYLISGASYDPQILQGKSHAQIAKALADPNSAIAKAVDGTANFVTAAICASTDNKPASVCTSSGVSKAAAALDKSK